MKITNECITLEGYVVANDITQATENFKDGVHMYDTCEGARNSWLYQENDPAKIYRVESQIKEY